MSLNGSEEYEEGDGRAVDMVRAGSELDEGSASLLILARERETVCIMTARHLRPARRKRVVAYNNTINSVGLYLGLLSGERRCSVLLEIRCTRRASMDGGRRGPRRGGPQRITEVPPLPDDLLRLVEHLKGKRRPFSLVSVATVGGYGECDFGVHLG